MIAPTIIPASTPPDMDLDLGGEAGVLVLAEVVDGLDIAGGMDEIGGLDIVNANEEVLVAVMVAKSTAHEVEVGFCELKDE